MFYFDEELRAITLGNLPDKPSERMQILLADLIFSFAAAMAMLREGKSFLLHGCLAASAKGGVVFFAPGGIGKSTTIRRLHAAGVPTAADDMLLCSEGSDGTLFVQPLPTWSRVFAGESSEWDFRAPLPLRHLILLDRSGDAENHLSEVAPDSYEARLFASVAMHSLAAAKLLPHQAGRELVRYFWTRTQMLCARFPARCLYSSLQSDLAEFLHKEGIIC